MKLKMFSVRDETDRACATPFLARTQETAYKLFKKAMEDRKANEGEFTLLYIGEFDDETAKIINAEKEPKEVKF